MRKVGRDDSTRSLAALTAKHLSPLHKRYVQCCEGLRGVSLTARLLSTASLSLCVFVLRV